MARLRSVAFALSYWVAGAFTVAERARFGKSGIEKDGSRYGRQTCHILEVTSHM